MECELVESALEGIFEQFRGSPSTPDAHQRLNEECMKYVRKYLIETGRIRVGPCMGCISIEEGIPFDILAFLPLCGMGVSVLGSYTVMQGLKVVGYVRYDGMPEQSRLDTVIVGAKTHFTPREEVSSLSLEIVYADEFGPLPEQLPYDTREDDENDAAAELHDQG